MKSMAEKMLILGLFFSLGGASVFFLLLMAHREDSEYKRWPTETATIDSSGVVRESEARLNSNVHSSRWVQTGYRRVPIWTVGIRYHFLHNGATIQGDRAFAHSQAEDIHDEKDLPSPRLQALATSLPAGAEVPVHYSPADPRDNYLIFLESPQNRKLFWMGTGLLLVGLSMVMVSRFLR